MTNTKQSKLKSLNTLTGYDDDFLSLYHENCQSLCSNPVYVSTDPRLRHMAHNGEMIALDEIPRNGKVPINSVEAGVGGWITQDGRYIPNPAPNVFGDILYYYDEDLSKPFINQLFREPSVVIKDMYVDPMGTYKPHYYKFPKLNDNCGVIGNNCLTWIRDSQFHREDLTSKQIWNRNQNDFGTAFTW